MSEAAVVAAPAVVEAPAPVAPPADAPATPVAPTPVQEPRNTQEAVQQARARVKEMLRPKTEEAPPETPATPAEAAPDPAAPKVERQRDPVTGKFVPEAGEVPAETPAPETPQWRKVALGGHPVAGSGVAEIAVQTEQEERALKALLNGSYVRVQENENLKRELAQAKEALQTKARAEIATQAEVEAAEAFKATPQYAARLERYNQILTTVGEDAAKDYWAGVKAEFKAFAEGKKTEKLAEADTAQHDADGQRIYQTALNYAWNGFEPEIRNHPEFQNWFHDEWFLLNQHCEQGRYDQVLAKFPDQQDRERALHTILAQRFMARVDREPVVVAQRTRTAAAAQAAAQQTQAQTLAAQQEAVRQQALREGAEAVRREAAERRATTPPHPLGPVAGSAVPGVSTPLTPKPTDASLTKEQAKQLAKQTVRSMAPAYRR